MGQECEYQIVADRDSGKFFQLVMRWTAKAGG
jgi:hypothetical protein